MITTELFIEEHQINYIIPECINLAKSVHAALPFQYMHMPLAWWNTFRCNQQELFYQKRGKNFLGIQSRLEKFFLIIAKDEGELCGFVPLTLLLVKTQAVQNEIKIITLSGDYVLHSVQDFVIRNAGRQQVVKVLLGRIYDLMHEYGSIFWAGYLPEDSPNLNAIRQACYELREKQIDVLEAISYQRGGVWPWTLNGIITTLEKMSSICAKKGEMVEGLKELTAKIAKCTPSSLLFPRTRETITEEIQDLLMRVKHNKDLLKLSQKLESFLENSPMLYPFIELPPERDIYFASLGRSTRKKMRAYTRKFFKSGGNFEIIQPHEVTDKDIKDYINLHLSRWGNSSASVCGDSFNYHMKISKQMAREGIFKLFFATYHGERIASNSCFDIGSRRESYLTGRDPKYQTYRVGNLLTLQTILDAIDRGFSHYGLGAVGFDHKMSFAKKAAVAHNFFFYPVNAMPDLDKIFCGFECMTPVR